MFFANVALTFSAPFSLGLCAFFSSFLLSGVSQDEAKGIGDPKQVDFELDLSDEILFSRFFSRHPQTSIYTAAWLIRRLTLAA